MKVNVAFSVQFYLNMNITWTVKMQEFEVDMHDMWQELQRDLHKQQLLIDEELRQSVDSIKANAATGSGNTVINVCFNNYFRSDLWLSSFSVVFSRRLPLVINSAVFL